MHPDSDREEREMAALFQTLDHPLPPLTVAGIVRRARARTRLRWAAGILLFVGVASAAYAAPGSPVPQWFRAAAERLGLPRRAVPTPAVPTASPAPDPAGVALVPGSQLRIDFQAEQTAGAITVSFGDSDMVSVTAPSGVARFASSPDRIAVDNRGTTASYEVQVPRAAPLIEIFVGDRRVLKKQGLHVTSVRLVCSKGKATFESREDTVSSRSISLSFLAAALACNSTGPSYNPNIPTSLVAAVTNQYFPLVPGTTFSYTTPGTQETNTVEVLTQTRLVNGVTARVIRDRVFVNGSLIEDTEDWYAQDADGNVWYLGEDSKEYQNGQVVGTAGSWEWGKNGALPGIIMWANPSTHLNEEYRQEYLKGEAEDWGKVVAAGQSVSVPFGQFTNCIKIEEWSALDPKRAFKYYCPQVGTALETPTSGSPRTELVTRTP